MAIALKEIHISSHFTISTKDLVEFMISTWKICLEKIAQETILTIDVSLVS